ASGRSGGGSPTRSAAAPSKPRDAVRAGDPARVAERADRGNAERHGADQPRPRRYPHPTRHGDPRYPDHVGRGPTLMLSSEESFTTRHERPSPHAHGPAP